MRPAVAEALLIALLAALVIARSVRVVRPGEAGVIVQLGRFVAVRDPGLVLLVPFVQTLRRVDMRELPSRQRYEATTRDGIRVVVDAVIWRRVVDPRLALFAIANYSLAVDLLLCTSLRAAVREATFDECSRWDDRVPARLQERMQPAARYWGVEIGRIELTVR
jgi:regulator of protease activity HflC (stomatin/prohibitin superfamily)